MSRTITSNTNVVVTVTLPPHLRIWFDRRRSWHKEMVRLHGETRFIADGAEARVRFLLDGTTVAVGTAEGKIKKGRLCGVDGKLGVEHALDWSLPPGAKGTRGLRGEVEVKDYAVTGESPLLELDLAPYVISG